MEFGDAHIHSGVADEGESLLDSDFRKPFFADSQIFDVELLLIYCRWGKQGRFHTPVEPVRSFCSSVAYLADGLTLVVASSTLSVA